MDTKTSPPDLSTKAKAPIYITVGPQCAGKTTYLSQIDGNFDVALDNVGFTYTPVTTDVLISDVVTTEGVDMRKYTANYEIVWISLFLLDMCTADDAVRNIMKNIQNPELEPILSTVLHNAAMNRDRMKSPTIDLFNASYRNNNAVNAGITELETILANPALNNRSVSWGNTNLVPKFFRQVLDLAYSHGRPVKFLRWGAEIPFVSLMELYSRNVRRFIESGRYIPLQTMYEFFQRANQLLAVKPKALSTHGVRTPNRINEKACASITSCGASTDHLCRKELSVFSHCQEHALMNHAASVSQQYSSTTSSNSDGHTSGGNEEDEKHVEYVAHLTPAELAKMAGYQLSENGTLGPLSSANAQAGGAALCRNFGSGRCAYGSKCRFRHVKS